MARTKLPGVTFETGLLIRQWKLSFGRYQEERHYHVIGRLDDGTPFKLHYVGSLTWWDAPIRLADGLRKKILGVLRETVRYAEAVPEYFAVHDLTELGKVDPEAARRRAEALADDFYNKVWRAVYLDDRDEDYLALAVPFAEKDAAKALGAKWDGLKKAWVINRKQVDVALFSRWLPVAA